MLSRIVHFVPGDPARPNARRYVRIKSVEIGLTRIGDDVMIG